LVVLQGLGRVERLVARQSTQGTLSIHARPDPTVLEDLETVVRRTGLDIERQASRRENVDVVIDFTLRGPKRLHDEAMIALLHHPSVRTVSPGGGRSAGRTAAPPASARPSPTSREPASCSRIRPRCTPSRSLTGRSPPSPISREASTGCASSRRWSGGRGRSSPTGRSWCASS